MPPRLPQLASLVIGVGVMALIGGGALLVAHLLGKSQSYRPYRRACLGFAGLCGFAGIATFLTILVPRLDQQPYETDLTMLWLALAVALSAYLLWGARGPRESAGLLILLGSTALLLIGNAWPQLPAPPPHIEMRTAWAALGTVYVLPCWFLWRKYLSRYVVSRRPPTFTLKRTLLIMAAYATCAALLFVALFWRGGHPSALLAAFAWAGAYYVGITLLMVGSITVRALHRRGCFQRWLSEEQQQLG